MTKARPTTRRDFLTGAATLGVASQLPLDAFAQDTNDRARRPKVAAIITVMTYRSHAHVIFENFLGPYLFNGKKTDPGDRFMAAVREGVADLGLEGPP